MKRRALLLAVTLGAALGCDHAPKGVVKEAAFGVFFGGQVQQLKEVAKELDPARQQHGFRLVFGAPLTHDVPVEWELSLPVPDKGGPRPALVRAKLSTAKTGESVLEVPLVFRPTDPLGAWHVKVTADGAVAIDRDFTVVTPPPPPKVAPKPLPPRAPDSASPGAPPQPQ